MYEIESLEKLREQFAKLPGIGPKSATRMAYHIIEMDPEEVKEFAKDMYAARLAVKYCKICGWPDGQGGLPNMRRREKGSFSNLRRKGYKGRSGFRESP